MGPTKWREEEGGKLQPRHRDRLAVVYVRQSTPQQVLDHQESTRLQYGLRSRAQVLGWAPDRVLVIDDDQGKSAATAVGRAGFQRLVSEVSLGHVGLILGIEMSRLARSCADWHQLLELCALFGTLIADTDGIYDPGHYNDRLLLGLKGTMSEAELHILRQRLHQGRLNKARRGALVIAVPIGYLRRPSGEVVLDPDEQAQGVVRLIFRKFEELGTLHAVLRYLVTHRIQLGLRLREGPERGELVWRRPNRMTLQNLLKNPIYAGAYAYGRKQVDPRRKQPGRPRTGWVVQAPADWHVLLRDRYPAYISWEQYERNCARLAANQARAEAQGAVRSGPALLAGLVVCGRCGRRLFVRYTATRASYVCERQRADYGAPPCQQLASRPLEQYVSAQVLEALAPAALELSLAATAYREQERADLLRHWEQRRQRAAYEAERAARHYRVIEPEHRLVARTLAREWEEKLAGQQAVEEEYHRFLAQQPRAFSAAEAAAIRRLAADIPELWWAPATTPAERKEIIRQVVERVTVVVEGESERVQVCITWVGGTRTGATIVRPVARLEQLSYYPELVGRVRALVAAGETPGAIAAHLNAAGMRPPKRRERFGAQGVADLIVRLGLRPRQAHGLNTAGLGTDEWALGDLAYRLAMPPVTLYTWVKRGWVQAQQRSGPGGQPRWVIRADPGEILRLEDLRRVPAAARAHDRWLAHMDMQDQRGVTPTEYT